MTKNDPRKALGKGLHSLLPTRTYCRPSSTCLRTAGTCLDGNVQHLPIEQVTPNPNQPRRDFDPAALMELTQSIEREGIIQPIIVRRTAPDEYQIIAGERRWRAAKAAGLTGSARHRANADDQQVLELALVENIQREDLNPIELATAFQRMATELGLSHDQIGQKTGKERTTITNSVRLLQLPQEIQSMIAAKQLSAGHARALLKFEDERTAAGNRGSDASPKDGRSARSRSSRGRSPHPSEKQKRSQRTRRSTPTSNSPCQELERVLGTKSPDRRERAGGRGRIEIEYYNRRRFEPDLRADHRTSPNNYDQ